jgi:alcohol dehydrogenase class IV
MSNLWFFSTPFVSFGEGALAFLENIPGQKCFIVTDPGLIKVKLLDILTEKLKKFGKSWQVFGAVEPDPKEETILKGLEQCKQFAPDLVIGLGGGSSIDAAKAIWVLYERPDLKMDDIHPFKPLNLGKKAKLLAIPTTSGTGSEATWATIITRKQPDGSDFKMELANREIIPPYAILDTAFTKGLPPRITVATAFDAYGHAFEALTASWRNVFSDALAVKAIQLIRHYLPIAAKNGGDISARENLHSAACMSGISFCNSQVNIGHALAHATGANFHFMHGEIVGLFLPYVLKYMVNDPKDPGSIKAESILAETAKMIGIADWSDSAKISVEKLLRDISRFQDELGFPKSMAKLGVTRAQIDEKMESTVDKVMESIGTALSPRSPTRETYQKIILCAFEGKEIDF